MCENIITRDSSEFKELRRNIIRAIQAVDIMIDTHRPAIGSEVYFTSEEVCSLFGLSKRSLQNYRDNRQIPYTSIGGKMRIPQAASFILLESHYGRARRCRTGGRSYLLPVFVFDKIAGMHDAYPPVLHSEIDPDRIFVQRQIIFVPE